EYTHYYLHRASWVVANQQNVPAGLQVSHTCDEPACFYPGHLTVETGVANHGRKDCWGQIFCPKHFNLLIDLCNHTPKCLKFSADPEAFNCCCPDPPSDNIFQAAALAWKRRVLGVESESS